jgi:hypothetical protein
MAGEFFPGDPAAQFRVPRDESVLAVDWCRPDHPHHSVMEGGNSAVGPSGEGSFGHPGSMFEHFPEFCD